MKQLKEVWTYRELLRTLVAKDIRGRYKGSVLGILWSFINPLLQVVVYWLVFPFLMRNTGEGDYLLYLVTGLIPWSYFQMTLSSSVSCIRANAGIVKKVWFPRVILPLAQVISGLISFFISCLIIVLFLLLRGAGLSWWILQVPFIALLESVLIFGPALILCSVDVYMQDTESITGFLLNLLMYGTPVIYQLDLLSGAGLLGRLVAFNPLTRFAQAYRAAFLYQQPADWPVLLAWTLAGCLLVGLGLWIFNRLQKGFAEKL